MKMGYVLTFVVAAAALFAFAGHARREAAPASTAPGVQGVPAMPAMPGATNAPENGDSVVSGRVLEKIDVAKYTYLRLATDKGEVWTAVPSTEMAVGASVTVEHTARMDHFASTTLKRTFDIIYFGSLRGAETARAGLPAGHPAIGTNAAPGNDPGIPEALLGNPGGALPPGHPPVGDDAVIAGGEPALPPGHPSAASTPEPAAIPKMARAPGPNGYLISDVYANARKLAGHRVRVRGMVTKVTLDVLGGTFLHLRDGSGEDAAKTNDLAVTTPLKPARGDVLLLEGVLGLDADLGIGYRYPALLKDATAVTEN